MARLDKHIDSRQNRTDSPDRTRTVRSGNVWDRAERGRVRVGTGQIGLNTERGRVEPDRSGPG